LSRSLSESAENQLCTIHELASTLTLQDFPYRQCLHSPERSTSGLLLRRSRGPYPPPNARIPHSLHLRLKPQRRRAGPPHTTETIAPIRHYPKWEPDVVVHVAQKPEAAIIEDAAAQEDLRAYSDGSAVDGGVGGAAVLMRGDVVVRKRRFHLGSDKEHTVYEGELIGMILAVELLKEEGGIGTMALGVDNQAAIAATGAFNSKPGHYLMDIFHDDLRKLIPTHDQRKLIVRWAPGHHDIPGNEAADEQAKIAARGDSSETLPKSLTDKNGAPIILPTSKSALNQQFGRKIQEEAASIMKHSPRFPRLHEIDPSAPSKNFSLLVAELPRRHSSLLFQLRTGHAPLNKHLHRIAKVPNPTCQQCHQREETVHHFLIACPSYARQRHVLRNEISHTPSQEFAEQPEMHQTAIPLHGKHSQTRTNFWRRHPPQR
jgi:ribonuclease HI